MVHNSAILGMDDSDDENDDVEFDGFWEDNVQVSDDPFHDLEHYNDTGSE